MLHKVRKSTSMQSRKRRISGRIRERNRVMHSLSLVFADLSILSLETQQFSISLLMRGPVTGQPRQCSGSGLPCGISGRPARCHPMELTRNDENCEFFTAEKGLINPKRLTQLERENCCSKPCTRAFCVFSIIRSNPMVLGRGIWFF